MSDRPSDGMGLDELREEFAWISEFQSRMAERICGDADVHNLVDYVGKLESENDKLREELEAAKHDLSLFSSVLVASKFENAKLREFVLTLAFCANDEADCDQCPMNGVRCDVVQQCFCDGAAETLRELGIEVE